MRDTRLVRHPLPNSTESFQGYLLRLVEANGHTSVGRTFAFAGLTRSDLSWTALDLTKLAQTIGRPVETLEAIAYKRRDDDDRTFRILGHPVAFQDLSLSNSKICPQCVDELGYVEATWDLDLFWGCPVHRRSPFWFCPRCDRRVPGNRRGMLICRCGTPMQNEPKQELSPESVALLDLIRYRLTDHRVLETTGSTFIEKELLEAPVDWMLSTIRSLGKYRLQANRVPEYRIRSRDILQAAATVVADWPIGYQRLVRDFDRKLRVTDAVPVPASLKQMYEAIFAAKEARYAGAPAMGL